MSRRAAPYPCRNWKPHWKHGPEKRQPGGHRGYEEIKPRGVQVPPALQEAFVASKLVGRLGEPRDIAEAILFLASERSSFITGQVISVDGGFFAHAPSTGDVRRAMEAMTGNPPTQP
jgi:NAD(P)-dependent dehydrogenase (short-subunit alcohol dehydrogenase family)